MEHNTDCSSVNNNDEEEISTILRRIESQGLLCERPETPKCRWIVSDERGYAYCTHPNNSPVYLRHLGCKVGICSIGCCPVSVFFPHQEF
jgi:hypothetical protein